MGILPNAKQSIIAGFRETGLLSFIKDKVWNQLSKDNLEHHEVQAIKTSMIDLLTEMRYSDKATRKHQNKKFAFIPGKCFFYKCQRIRKYFDRKLYRRSI